MNPPTKNSSPVYSDKSKGIAVYLDTRTVTSGQNAGKTFEIFNYVSGKDRIQVPVACGGYNLTGEEAAMLVSGEQLCREMPNKNTEGHHHIIIAGIGLNERKGASTTFKSLQVVAALAEMPQRQPDEDESAFQKHKDKPRAFLIPSRDPATNQESKLRDLKCYTTVSAKDAHGKTHFLPLYVCDAYAARDHLASGAKEPFSFTAKQYGQEFRITLEGITTLEKTKTQVKVLKFNAVCLTQSQAESQPLPQPRSERGSPAKR